MNTNLDELIDAFNEGRVHLVITQRGRATRTVDEQAAVQAWLDQCKDKLFEALKARAQNTSSSRHER